MGARRRGVARIAFLTTPAHGVATPRLSLRPCAAADAGALHALWTDAAVRRWLWDDVVIDRATAAAVIAASEASFAAQGFGMWCVEVRDSETRLVSRAKVTYKLSAPR